MEYRVKDITLADIGKKRIDWAESHMPVLNALRKKFENTKPLQGLKLQVVSMLLKRQVC